ncbi:flagellar brake protein [Parapusillimonas granuli]|uniref:Flagellar brake protein YcgR n=1 Tax=Parapusillimonas granuli TaxID=380911 RepID=A0A853G7U0_9BURK|nr:flagellar brake protein [Parapusillimonas granuli]MBB5215976.1 c-di-GMP-binding flagellar brake protein YcgR [Parapusillimonas granuli]MEB2401251.1 flagellar brake protein [Alcaligenaceae bacterium]NYT50726.1 flagellar brake protein [Parapusillimonas granuli]
MPNNIKPFQDELDDERYLVTSKLEIRSILRAIERNKALLRLQITGSSVGIVTTVLKVEDDATIIDATRNDAINRRLIAGEDEIRLETNLERVLIRFFATNITACEHEGAPALRMAFPERLQRIQRREHYRIDVPASNPAKCTIPRESAGQDKEVTLDVRDISWDGNKDVTVELKDISAGGVSIVSYAANFPHGKGTIYSNCRLDLPDVGSITVNLKVVQARTETQANGKERVVIGCAFVDLDRGAQQDIQRYINVLERKLIAKRRGLE